MLVHFVCDNINIVMDKTSGYSRLGVIDPQTQFSLGKKYLFSKSVETYLILNMHLLDAGKFIRLLRLDFILLLLDTVFILHICSEFSTILFLTSTTMLFIRRHILSNYIYLKIRICEQCSPCNAIEHANNS